MAKKPVKDVFGFWQIKGAELSGKYEIPVIHGTSKVPDSLTLFTNCENEENTQTKAVHFFQLDENFVSCLESETKLTKNLKHSESFKVLFLQIIVFIGICHLLNKFIKFIKAEQ